MDFHFTDHNYVLCPNCLARYAEESQGFPSASCLVTRVKEKQSSPPEGLKRRSSSMALDNAKAKDLLTVKYTVEENGKRA